MLSQSHRSRLQNSESFVDDEEDVDAGNGLEEGAVEPVIVENNNVNMSTTTTEDYPATTDIDVDVNESVSNNITQVERIDSSSALPESTTTTTVEIKNETTTKPVSTQDPRLSYDDSEWKPLFVNTRTTGVSSTTASVVIPQYSPALTDMDNHSPTDEDGHDPHVDDVYADYEDEEVTTDLPTNWVKQDRVIATAVDEDKVGSNSSTPPPTPSTKFSFLQWFNAQLNNVKLAQQNRPQINSTTPMTFLNNPSSNTRFFTLKPTAVSYTGIQPILRPKPWEENSTEPMHPELSPSATVADLVLSAMNQTLIEATGAILPRPFQVQTTLNLAKESVKLVESPRSQKSLALPADNLETGIRFSTGTTPRVLRHDRQQQVELLKDFFPPVRRPVSRPQTTKSNLQQQEAASLPIEGLFSTLKPPGIQQQEQSSHQVRSNNNSPIYTFKLNQGQSVHDVLSQLLADLTVGESPAQVEVDGAAPSLTMSEQEQQVDVKNLKASNKKVDDDRLKPWAHTPFRPAILNALYNTRHNSTSTNVEVSTQQLNTTLTTTTPNHEDVIVTTELATLNHVTNTWPTDSTTTGKPITANYLGLFPIHRFSNFLNRVFWIFKWPFVSYQTFYGRDFQCFMDYS